MLRHAILLVLVVFIAHRTAAQCPKMMYEQTCTFTDDEGATITIDADRAGCRLYPDNCCWKSGRCLSKFETKEIVVPPKEDKKPGETGKKGNPFGKPGAARFLPGFKPPIPPICPKGKPTVPLECKYQDPQPYVTEPPTDVPYCVRIPCSMDRKMQAVYDQNHFECGSQPGCYYDVELGDFRKAFGPGVLAGVPVCHLAVRNTVFLREAQKAIATARKWNPYYTACLIDRFREEIEAETDGCKFIDVLRVFKIQPKMAGWKGINRRQCSLIGGCWKYAQCFYPYEINQDITVKSGQRFNTNKYEIRFGRPKCQEFDNRTPYSTLKSYHNCLMSGCSVDSSISNNYYKYLFEIGQTMSVTDNWEYWKRVEAGKIAAHNFDDSVVWDYKKSYDMMGSGPAPPPKPPTSSGPFSQPGAGLPPPPPPPGGFGAPPSGAGVFAPPSSGGFSPPGSSPSAGASQSCGPGFIQYGARPCPPRQPPVIPRHRHCPYKPFHVPRFEPLKGSFKGCCDINLCYLSRADIRKMHSGPSRYMTEWTYWSKCSATCGRGTRTRTRQCIGNNYEKCDGQMLKQTEPCEEAKCGKWTNWSPWSPPCDCRGWIFGGTERKRRCLPRGAICKGEAEEAMGCAEYCKLYG